MRQRNNLNRFMKKHRQYYDQALFEVKNGRKEGHWMWFIFPQLKSLGKSFKAKYYGLSGIEEAQEFLNNEYLGAHLQEISDALLNIPSDIILFDFPDNLKLKSCMTLFALAAPETKVFQKILDKYFSGEYDEQTLLLLQNKE